MQAKLEKIENSEDYIAVEVDAEQLEQGLEIAYRKVVKEVAIPGFRKGRVPRQLLESYFGKEVLFQDALEYIVPTAYEQAIDELNIEPIAQPDFELDEELEAGKNFAFKVRVAVKPEVELGQIEGLEIKIPHLKITEEDIDKRLEDMQRRYSQLEEKTDEPAEMTDVLSMDFEGFIDGVAFEGGSGEDYSLELGSNTFIPGFEEQLAGMTVGSTKDVTVTFPENYHAEELAGKEAIFKVKVNKIETHRLRELNDEFAQEVSQFETLEELREDLSNGLSQMLEHRKNELIKQEVLDKAIEICTVPAPDAVIRTQIERMMKQFGQRLMSQGLNMELYFQYTGSSEDDLISDMWPEAERIVKTTFLLEKLVEEKGFEVTDEELNKEVEDAAVSMGVDPEQARQNLAGIMDDIEFSIKMDKATRYLIDNAVITEYDTDEEMAKEE